MPLYTLPPFIRILIVALSVFLAGTPAFSQDLSASQIRNIRETQALLVTNPEKAYRMAQEMAHSPNEGYRLSGEYYIANYHYNQSDYRLAEKELVQLLERLAQKGNPHYAGLKAMCVNKLFYLHKNLGEYGRALYYLEKYKSGFPANRFAEQYGIAKIALGDYARGIAMLKKAAATSPHLQLGIGENKAMNDKLFADKFNAIGEAYQRYYIQAEKAALIDSADLYFDKAAARMTQNGFEVAYTKALLNMHRAKSAALRGQYETALALYRDGKHYKAARRNIRTVQLFDLGMADCFYHLQQYDSALVYSQRFIRNYAVTGISKENLLIAYNILSKSYDRKGDSKKANHYAQKSLELIASMEKIKNTSLDFVHNYDLQNIQAESEAILSQKNYFRGSLFGILAILAVVAGSFYYYYQLQRKKHRRFLAIIARLKEPASVKKSAIEEAMPAAKPTLDAEFIEKTSQGLQKLAHKEAYLQPHFKLAFVAKKLHTNTAYLSQYFNQVEQKTFSEYVQELRIHYVLRKLNDSAHFRNYTLQAIAEEVGYKDATAFVRVFKKQTGLSPAYYIDELKK